MMFHCRGGVGAERFDAMTVVINWVENGTAPESITASRIEQGEVTRTRPLYPDPKVARYNGSGSTDIAASFARSNP